MLIGNQLSSAPRKLSAGTEAFASVPALRVQKAGGSRESAALEPPNDS